MIVFDRLRPGFYLLIALAVLQFMLVLPVGNADLSLYVSLDGLTRTLIPAWSLFPLVWAGGIGVVVARRKVDRPFRAMRSMIYRNRAWLVRCSIMAVLMITVARTVTSYKTAIPQLVPYWADPYLADADASLFGTDPWRLTHALIGPFGTLVIDRIYALWFMVMMVCLGWFCFTRNPKLQLRGLLTSFLSWSLLGVVSATLFASVGPCYYQVFYGDPRFAGLLVNLNAYGEDNMLLVNNTMKLLLAAYGEDRFGAGISAMPSLHVTIATMCFLACLSYSRHLWLKVVAGLFAAAIMVGSVHLGWHYALDGIVGIVAVALIWWATGRFVDWLEASEANRAATFPNAKAALVGA